MLYMAPDVLTTTEAAAQLAQVREELDSERGRADELAHSYALLQSRWEEEGAAHAAALADMQLQIQLVRFQTSIWLAC